MATPPKSPDYFTSPPSLPQVPIGKQEEILSSTTTEKVAKRTIDRLSSVETNPEKKRIIDSNWLYNENEELWSDQRGLALKQKMEKIFTLVTIKTPTKENPHLVYTIPLSGAQNIMPHLKETEIIWEHPSSPNNPFILLEASRSLAQLAFARIEDQKSQLPLLALAREHPKNFTPIFQDIVLLARLHNMEDVLKQCTDFLAQRIQLRPGSAMQRLQWALRCDPQCDAYALWKEAFTQFILAASPAIAFSTLLTLVTCDTQSFAHFDQESFRSFLTTAFRQKIHNSSFYPPPAWERSFKNGIACLNQFYPNLRFSPLLLLELIGHVNLSWNARLPSFFNDPSTSTEELLFYALGAMHPKNYSQMMEKLNAISEEEKAKHAYLWELTLVVANFNRPEVRPESGAVAYTVIDEFLDELEINLPDTVYSLLLQADLYSQLKHWEELQDRCTRALAKDLNNQEAKELMKKAEEGLARMEEPDHIS